MGERGAGEGDLEALSLASWRGGEGGGEAMVVGRVVGAEEEEEVRVVEVRVGRGERGVGTDTRGAEGVAVEAET